MDSIFEFVLLMLAAQLVNLYLDGIGDQISPNGCFPRLTNTVNAVDCCGGPKNEELI